MFTLRANKNIKEGGKIRLIENNVLQEYAVFDFMTAAMEIMQIASKCTCNVRLQFLIISWPK